jgi:hypothetical protein
MTCIIIVAFNFMHHGDITMHLTMDYVMVMDLAMAATGTTTIMTMAITVLLLAEFPRLVGGAITSYVTHAIRRTSYVLIVRRLRVHTVIAAVVMDTGLLM